MVLILRCYYWLKLTLSSFLIFTFIYAIDKTRGVSPFSDFCMGLTHAAGIQDFTNYTYFQAGKMSFPFMLAILISSLILFAIKGKSARMVRILIFIEIFIGLLGNVVTLLIPLVIFTLTFTNAFKQYCSSGSKQPGSFRRNDPGISIIKLYFLCETCGFTLPSATAPALLYLLHPCSKQPGSFRRNDPEISIIKLYFLCETQVSHFLSR